LREVALVLDVDLAMEVGGMGIKDNLGVVVDTLTVDTGCHCSCWVLAGGDDEKTVG
jgi:hypothetical protein